MRKESNSKPSACRSRPCRLLACFVWLLFIAIVCTLCGGALFFAVRASEQCQWPAEWDTLRDMGMAQTLLDGNYPSDPILSGETLWYNPLTGVMIAATSRILHLSLSETSITIGPYVNLIAPAALVVLLTVFFGRAAALAGLCVMLFAKDPQTPFWVNACYSPWLLAPLYSLGLFFLTLIAYREGIKRSSLLWCGIAGILLSITFMAHTAPALIIGGIVVLTTLLETGMRWHEKRSNSAVAAASRLPVRLLFFHVGLLLFLAFLISLPYTWSILRRYQFKVENPFPSLFAADYVRLNALPDRIYESLNWKNLLALAGIGVLLRRFRQDETARLVICWLVVALAFLGHHYLWQYLLSKNIVLTAFVPAHHAAIHLSAVRAVLFAVGIVFLGRVVAKPVHLACGTHLSTSWQRRLQQAIILVVVALTGSILYRTHPITTRADFLVPDRALYHEFHEQGIPMYNWILEHTTPEAVFLCEEESVGMTVVMPAGRKLVSPMLLYSNPYVPFAPLFEAKKNLLSAIENTEREVFCQHAEDYPVLYLLVKMGKSQENSKKYEAFFEKLHEAGNLVVWRARKCDI